MRKIVSMLLAVSFLLLALASCGVPEGEQPTEAPKATEGPTDTQAPEATDPPSSGDDENEGGNEEENKPENENKDENLPFVPVVRFAVASDMHVKTADDEQARRTALMINQMQAYAKTNADGYAKLDAFFIAGDLTDNGKPSEFKAINDVFKANIEEGTELILAIGNHDSWTSKDPEGGRPAFLKEFGENSTMRDEVIGGYHVLSIYGDGNNTGSDYTQKMCDELEKRIKAAIADTGANKPVFVVQHVGELNTVVGTDSYTHERSYAATDALYEMKSKYPNLIVFSGHTHFPNNDECSIWQGDFTAISTGSLYYALQSLNNGEQVAIANRYDLAQCYVVEVDQYGRTKIKCWDVLQEKFVGEEWMIDSYDPTEFKYTIDRFSSEDIFFAEDAEIKLESSFASMAILSFPPVPEDSIAGRVYEVKVYEKGGALKSTQYIGDDYFKDIFDRRINVSIEDLVKGKEYTVEVRALNSLYVTEITTGGTLKTQPLKLDFTLGEATSSADLIDLEINSANNTVKNNVSIGLDASVSGELKTAYDETIKKDVLVLDGSGNGVVNFGNYTIIGKELEDSFTVEAYFKVNSTSNAYIIGATQHGGFSVDVYGGKLRVAVDADPDLDTATYKTLSFNFVVGAYYHLVMSYDGSATTVYVNGKSIGKIEGANKFGLPKNESARVVWLGVDVSGSGAHENKTFGNCAIADFKLYTYALTEEQVKTEFGKAPTPPEVTVPTRENETLVDMQLDSSTGAVTNSASDIATYIDGSAIIVRDNAIGKDVLEINGSANGMVRFGSYVNYKDDIADSVSVEAYIKVNGTPSSKAHHVLFGGLQSGGFGLEVFGDNYGTKYGYDLSSKMAFFFHNGTEYICLPFDYTVGEYYHVVATYDGSNFKLYVNGELVGTRAMSTLQLPPDEAQAFNVWLGGDAGRNGSHEEQYYGKCSFAEFKIYNYALTATQVTSAYTAISQIG